MALISWFLLLDYSSFLLSLSFFLHMIYHFFPFLSWNWSKLRNFDLQRIPFIELEIFTLSSRTFFQFCLLFLTSTTNNTYNRVIAVRKVDARDFIVFYAWLADTTFLFENFVVNIDFTKSIRKELILFINPTFGVVTSTKKVSSRWKRLLLGLGLGDLFDLFF